MCARAYRAALTHLVVIGVAVADRLDLGRERVEERDVVFCCNDVEEKVEVLDDEQQVLGLLRVVGVVGEQVDEADKTIDKELSLAAVRCPGRGVDEELDLRPDEGRDLVLVVGSEVEHDGKVIVEPVHTQVLGELLDEALPDEEARVLDLDGEDQEVWLDKVAIVGRPGELEERSARLKANAGV
jgi:hypothetical protein